MSSPALNQSHSEPLVLCQILIDEFGESAHPSIASHDPGATEGGLPWLENGHTR